MSSRTFGSLQVALLAVSLIVFSSGFAMAQEKDSAYTNSIGMKFVLIPAGTFMMGGDSTIEKPEDDELPRHKVKISKPFYLGVYEVTQRQWKTVMGYNPSYFKGEDNPVEMASWVDIQEFIKRLNKKEKHSRYRLPTEAEWEYAIRAGTTSVNYFGNDMSQILDYAWIEDNSGGTTHPVGLKRPNPWGLYDMIGNVWEFVKDWYGENYYAKSPSVDPTGPSSGTGRVDRGCGWRGPWLCRSAFRASHDPTSPFEGDGFRLALSVGRGK
jgi:formylglycine-generating enzyme required for sulfatase activity